MATATATPVLTKEHITSTERLLDQRDEQALPKLTVRRTGRTEYKVIDQNGTVIVGEIREKRIATALTHILGALMPSLDYLGL